MTPEEQRAIRARQRSRSIATAVVLIAMVILFFGITLAKLSH
ncbi:hypothetical protein [Sphingobium sufflavum]|nr:hypothetical protein [Sphingobium sufflavum]